VSAPSLLPRREHDQPVAIGNKRKAASADLEEAHLKAASKRRLVPLHAVDLTVSESESELDASSALLREDEDAGAAVLDSVSDSDDDGRFVRPRKLTKKQKTDARVKGASVKLKADIAVIRAKAEERVQKRIARETQPKPVRVSLIKKKAVHVAVIELD